ncbi:MULTISPECIES: RNA polymerase factor sigma-54 [Enterococcaceae]|uniref:RNA polymerase factor sigma-54 n=1 Tax=Enterococcaceae TaxID=81852 RepID=UPI000E4D9C7D|nr:MULTISPECIES: RNA polymerase factor sigma-54 [Enterococcaceae]MCI0130053.1 RNA polymerase factor sigma-54 [Vagococcus sp. CY53-2]RGI30913.1 RNA polymerase sigma-54 factor [Melissococcus sp. OM08-11BH]
MKMSQHVRQGQSQVQTQKLAMTQQLQQSIKILQYGTEDLLSFLNDKMLENPLIDVSVFEMDDQYLVPKDYDVSKSDRKTDWINQIPETTQSLFHYLIEQIHLNYRDTALRSLSLFLVEFIDTNGYLTISIEEAMKLKQVTYIEVLDALTLIQMLEPAGVGARNLQECLMLQIERDDNAPNQAYLVLEEYFDELANRKWQKIEKKLGISLVEIQEIFDYIQKLHPNPGSLFHSDEDNIIYPDLEVKVDRTDNSISIVSTKVGKPNISFQTTYFEKMSHQGGDEVKKYLNDKKSEFEWLKKSLEQRGNTILRVGEEIVKKQSAFFIESDHPLTPMKLKSVAEELSLHESTISRAVNGKYLTTDFGVFELRSFFSTGLEQKNSNEVIGTNNVKQLIEIIIKEENKAKPLSDQKIVDLLKEKNIQISRRTVAKYREELGIQSSSMRKRFDN